MVGIPPNNPLKDLEMPYPRAEALGFRNQLPPRANALGFQKKISVGRHRRETPLVSPGGSANQEPPFSPPTGGSNGTARSLGRPRGLGSVVASVQILGRRAILGGVSLGCGRFLPVPTTALVLCTGARMHPLLLSNNVLGIPNTW